MHTSKPVFTAQFHPEAFGGPTDTEVCHISENDFTKVICYIKIHFIMVILLWSFHGSLHESNLFIMKVIYYGSFMKVVHFMKVIYRI